MPPIATASPDARIREYADKLSRRKDELRLLLQSAAGAAVGAADNRTELLDFKDVAAEDSRVMVDEIALSHATEELDRVVAALRHIEDGTYGYCEDCGEAIDERRLMALPATRFCTACQSIHERPAAARR
jgi:DnaK suppressor protein